MNEGDNIKIKVAARLYLLRYKKATSNEICQYIYDSNIPLKRTITPQNVARVLKSTKANWGFVSSREDTKHYVWSVKE